MIPIAYDFYHLWASGRVAYAGGNPYAPEQIAPVMLEVGWPAAERVSGFMHPFWSLSLFCPLSLLPFPLAVLVWEFLIVALVAWAMTLIYRAPIVRELACLPKPVTAFLAVALFPPLMSTLLFGQTSGVLLIGFVGWLSLFCQSRFFTAGVLLSLTTFKPHIFLLLYAWIFVSQLRKRNGTCIAGFATGIVLQSAIALMCAPHAAAQWIAAINSTSASALWLPTPSGARLLSLLLGVPQLQSLLVILATIFVAVYAWIRPQKIALRATLVLLPLGYLTTPYVWSHTFLVLIVPYLCLIASLERVSDRAVVGMTLTLATFGIFEMCYVSTMGPYFVLLPLALFLAGAYWTRRRGGLHQVG